MSSGLLVNEENLWIEVCDMSNKIFIKDYNLYYNDFHALKNINLNIYSNKITAIIGTSGSGKSTLLKSINRMNDFIEGCKITGDIVINEKSIYNNTDLVNLRARVGMIFQESNLFPQSIYDNLVFGAKLKGKTNRYDLDMTVEEVLRKVWVWDEIKDSLRQNALQLPLATQQLLCIARILVLQPEILLLDEPTALLDSTASIKIGELINQLKNEYTIILTTNKMLEAVRFSDNTIFMQDGEVVEYNNTETLFRIPADIRTEDYITRRFN